MYVNVNYAFRIYHVQTRCILIIFAIQRFHLFCTLSSVVLGWPTLKQNLLGSDNQISFNIRVGILFCFGILCGTRHEAKI